MPTHPPILYLPSTSTNPISSPHITTNKHSKQTPPVCRPPTQKNRPASGPQNAKQPGTARTKRQPQRPSTAPNAMRKLLLVTSVILNLGLRRRGSVGSFGGSLTGRQVVEVGAMRDRGRRNNRRGRGRGRGRRRKRRGED
ncbi:hypothetical protein P167DRAFT_603696, partial [Morchella conica CCBAS932]